MAIVALDAALVVTTIERLRDRIHQRFPNSGLERVCAGLADTAKRTAAKTDYIKARNLILRTGIAIILGLSLFLLLSVSRNIRVTKGAPRALDIVQGLGSSINILLLGFGGAAFLLTIKTRAEAPQRHRGVAGNSRPRASHRHAPAEQGPRHDRRRPHVGQPEARHDGV